MLRIASLRTPYELRRSKVAPAMIVRSGKFRQFKCSSPLSRTSLPAVLRGEVRSLPLPLHFVSLASGRRLFLLAVTLCTAGLRPRFCGWLGNYVREGIHPLVKRSDRGSLRLRSFTRATLF